MDSPGYLIIYNSKRPDRWDDGDDPDFQEVPFSWGICRPQVRRYTKPGQVLFFVARDKATTSGGFYLKGYFKVARKLTLLDVLSDEILSRRRNVIIEEIDAESDPLIALKHYLRKHSGEIRWDNSFRFIRRSADLRPVELADPNERDIALCMFEENGRRFIHRHIDNHHLDDWRCGRLFLCSHKVRPNCLTRGECPNRTSEGLGDRPYYVVGDIRDYGRLEEGISWQDVADCLGAEYDRLLRSAIVDSSDRKNAGHFEDMKGQSNAVKLTTEQIDQLKSLFLSRTMATDSHGHA